MGRKGTSKYAEALSTGQRVNRWTVTGERVYVNKNALIRCRCDCGYEAEVNVASLLNQTSTQCNKCARQREKNSQWNGIGSIGSGQYRGVKGKKARELISTLWDESGGKCALTGWPISILDGTASPDRKDSSLGYVDGNVQWVHRTANIAKNLFELDHFITLCHAVARNFPDPGMTSTAAKFGRKKTR